MKISLSYKVAIGTFFIAGIGILLVSFLSFIQIRDYVKENMLSSLEYELGEDSKQINKDIETMKKNVKLLINSEQIAAIYRAKNNKYNYDAVSNETFDSLTVKLGKTFKSVLEHSDAYFNIRLIDLSGDELVVSVKDRKGSVIIQKNDALQNKKTRSYFKEAIALAKNDVYISKVELNKEHGVFSIPHIPTIRVAMPVYIDKNLFAILIINANINKLFSILGNNLNEDRKLFIANSDGYYIYNEQQEKTFGFDLGNEYKIENDFSLSAPSYFNGESAFSHKRVYVKKDKYFIFAISTSDRFLKEQSKEYKQKLGVYILIVTMLVALFSLLLMKYLITPFTRLTKQAQDITSGSKAIEFEIIHRNDEIGELSKSLKLMIEKIENSKKEVEQKVEERTKQLHDLNENLEEIVQIKTKENIQQLEAMQEQNKMASMGEMIGAIAHQWRQPLNEIGIAIQNLKYDYEDGLVDKAFLDSFITKNKEIIKFMSSTIDDFRNFYRVDKEKELFDAKDAISKTLSLQMAQLVNNEISIFIDGISFEINGFRNEFLQVILNIINNAKDALIEKKIENAKIEIVLEERSIVIRDNAGGIAEDVLERIFEPYFTTKEQGKGTGMGLYMSKMIIEDNMNAKLSVKNVDDGAEFRMDFNEV